MSLYLSKYYCGNLENKCNFQEPLDYTKITDRQFIDVFAKKTEECEKMKGKKGFCCIKNENTEKEFNKEHINMINDEAKMEVFGKNYEIPLVKVSEKDGKIESIDLCNCGGSEDFKECIEDRCKGFRKPSIYEYCKLGDYNRAECIVENKEGPGISENEFDNVSERCKLKRLSDERVNIKINDLTKDCYKNLCENRNLDSLRNRYTTDDKYFKIGDNPKAYGLILNEKEKGGKSLRDYFRR